MNKITIPLLVFPFFYNPLFAQTDTVPPVLVCHNSLNASLTPLSTVTVWAADFLDTFYDNTGAAPELGVRKACTGNAFPENQAYVIFYPNEMGQQQAVEVWARDAAGNAASCMTDVAVVDPVGNIDPGSAIHVFTPEDEGIDSTQIKVKGDHCLFGPIEYQVSDTTNWFWGWGAWVKTGSIVPAAGYNFRVTPSKNINPLNGVSTYDLVLIHKHIIGLEPLDSPYKLIAADANQDGKVTSFDIITLRKLILGITSELPNGKSWRFVPNDYLFINPANPFLPPFPEFIEVPNTADPAPSGFAFKGVKIGDVDYSADPGQ